MTTNEQHSHPLAWSQSGSPITLPPEAKLWRVRRLSGSTKGGAPEVIYGADGIPLLLMVETTPDEFAEAVSRRPGKYRLDALDESHQPVADAPPAYHVVAEFHGHGHNPAASAPQSADAVAAANQALVDALKDSSARMAEMVAATSNIITAADGAGIARRKPLPADPPIVVEPIAPAVPREESEQVPQTPWWQDLVAGVAPVVVQLAPMFMNYMVQTRAANAQQAPPRSQPQPAARPQPAPEPEESAEPEIEPDLEAELRDLDIDDDHDAEPSKDAA